MDDGSALSTFEAMLEAQGVPPTTARALCAGTPQQRRRVLGGATTVEELRAPHDGAVLGVAALPLAQTLNAMGAGRTRTGERIDPTVGAEVLVEAGQRLREGDPWLRLHHNGRVGTAHRRALQSALLLAPDPAHGTDTDTDTGTAAPSRIAAIILPRTEPRGAAQQ